MDADGCEGVRGYAGARRRIGVLLLAATLTQGCSTGSPTARRVGSVRGPVRVVASFYPLAWLTERLGGSRVAVRDLTPPGAEPHDVEIDADRVDAIATADLVVIMGHDFQPSIEAAAKKRANETVIALDVLPPKQLRRNRVDPHIWLDPVLMTAVAKAVHARLVVLDPAHRSAFDTNEADVAQQLSALDTEYRVGLARCARKDLVTSHAAFGRLASRYGLIQQGIAGFSPDSEPDPRRLAELADFVRINGVTTVFSEDLYPAKLADTLARETGVRAAVLSPIEALTQSQRAKHADYVSLMRANLIAIRAALGCT